MANLLLVCWCFAVRCISRLVTHQEEIQLAIRPRLGFVISCLRCCVHLQKYRECAYTARSASQRRPSSTCSTGNNSRPEGTRQITGNPQPHHPRLSSTSSDGPGLLAPTAFCAHCLSSGGGLSCIFSFSSSFCLALELSVSRVSMLLLSVSELSQPCSPFHTVVDNVQGFFLLSKFLKLDFENIVFFFWGRFSCSVFRLAGGSQLKHMPQHCVSWFYVFLLGNVRVVIMTRSWFGDLRQDIRFCVYRWWWGE